MPDDNSRGPIRVTGLEGRLEAGAFVVTAEVTPPLSANPEAVVQLAAPLRGRIDAINVTDAPGARTAMCSLAAAAILAREGHEPVLQITCRDRNRIALAGDLLGAAALGVRNVLVLRGDDPARGDEPEAKPVFDLDSRAVMRLARRMRDEGTLPSGRAIATRPRFFIGAADTPVDPAPDWRPDDLIGKLEAGAGFVQTQFCYDAVPVRRYMARLADFGLTDKLRFLIGVGPLASPRAARWMNEHLFGVRVPEPVIERLERAVDPAAEGRRICIDLIHALRQVPGVAGVHIMAPRQGAPAIAQVVEGLDFGERT